MDNNPLIVNKLSDRIINSINNHWPSRNLIGLATFGKNFNKKFKAYSALVASVNKTGDSDAAWDTHANVSLVNSHTLLSDIKTISNFTIDGIGGQVKATHIGTLRFSVTSTDGTIIGLKLKNVLVVPGCSRRCIMCAHDFVNIKEVKQCVMRNGKSSFIELQNGLKIKLKSENSLSSLEFTPLVADDKKRKREYSLSALASSFSSVFTSNKNKKSYGEAHAILCHPSENKMKLIKKNNLIKNIDWYGDELQHPCYCCAIGKAHLSAKIANKEPSVALKRGDRIFTDIEGPIAAMGYGGVRWAVHFTDSYSRFTVTYFMKQKSDVNKALEKYIKEYCTPVGVTIKKIQSDAEAVYIGPKCLFRATCNKFNILLTSSSPYSHWENGVAERVIRTFMEKAFAVMAQRDLASAHWPHALSHVFKVNNCLPQTSINNETPYWRWYEENPDLGNVHTFGCDVRVNVATEFKPRKYVDPPGYMAIYIGFDYDSSAHKIFKPSYGANKYVIEQRGDRHCQFFELFDNNLFLKQHDDAAYVEYFHNKTKGPALSGGENTIKSALPVRIAKKFWDVLYFGTAVKNNSDGQYPYNVTYDDGDFETFSESEFTKSVSLFASQPDSIQKQNNIETDEIGVEVLQGHNKILRILKHKIVRQNNVSYACFKIKLKNKNIQKTQWAQAGSLLALSGKEYLSNNWNMVHDYVEKHDVSGDEFLFQYHTTKTPSARTKRRAQKYKVFGAINDGASQSVLCVYPDGTYTEVPQILLKNASVSSLEGVNITRDSYVPTDYPEVLTMNNPVWLKAVENCMDSTINIAKTGHWVKLKDVSERAISSRFVLQAKYRVATDTYEAFCRWTPRGFDESEDVHYDPEYTFAGTPQLAVLRYILTKSLFTGQKSFHLDFKRAFPSTPLDRTIYVKLPKGYKHYDEDGDECIIALDKSAEGLKQSGANWLDMLTLFLKENGYSQSVTEPKLFTKDVFKNSKKIGTCDIMVYIDDLIGTCCCDEFVKDLVQDFNTKFGVTCNHLGEVKHALGIDVERDGDDTILLHQSQKIRDLLTKYDMLDCVPRTIPIQTSFKISEALDGELLNAEDKTKYQSIVGSYLWINRGTRPDISEATWLLARGMSAPTKEMLAAAMHCLRYLKGTINKKLIYSHNKYSSLDLTEYDYNSSIPTGFCDSNWDKPKSHSSNIIMFCNGALTWSTHKQESTALSTVQAELCALSEQAIENKYCSLVFEFLNMKFKDPLPIFCDSKGAIQNAKHPTTKNKLKHVDIKCFFIRECIDRKIVSVFKILGTDNPADVGTKLLGSLKFDLFSNFLMNLKDVSKTKELYAISEINSRRRVKFGF